MEPYKYGELGDFDAKYLSGFQAEVYDEDKNTLLPRAKKKADKYSQKYLSSYNVEYDAVRPTVNDKEEYGKRILLFIFTSMALCVPLSGKKIMNFSQWTDR